VDLQGGTALPSPGQPPGRQRFPIKSNGQSVGWHPYTIYHARRISKMGSETMKAVVVERPGEIAIRQIPIPEPTEYQALVRNEVVAICNSTDTKLRDGHFPEFDTYPCRLGHEGIGTVVKVGKKVKSFKVGDRVINASYEISCAGLAPCFGTFAEYAIAGDHIVMTEDNVADKAHYYDPVFETQKVVPPDIPSRQAILLSTWREVYSSFGDFHIEPNSGSMLIIGGGPVGQSFVTIAKNIWKLDQSF
jgi:NADPH:quinone reductase-like Zn-dependent oxidoreductase